MYQTPSNICIFSGVLAKEPLIGESQGQNGTFKTANFTLAVKRQLAASQKGKAADVDFIPFRLTGPSVAILEKQGQVGKAFSVVAKYYEYTVENNGQKQYRHVFEVDTITFPASDTKAVRDAQQSNTGGSNYQAAAPGYNTVAANTGTPQTSEAPFSMFEPSGPDNTGF